MNIRLAILMITALPFLAKPVLAADFYGASVFDKDVPTITWKAGIDGIHPIVSNVEYGSPARKAGFKNGDIILSINNKDIKRSSDLDKFTANALNVRILNGTTWNTLTIDRQVIAAEKANSIAVERNAPTPAISHSPQVNTTQDNLPPLKFDDASLDSMYGKTTPAELARQRQIAERIERADTAKEREQTETARRQAELQLQMSRQAVEQEETRQRAARIAEAQQAQRQQAVMQNQQPYGASQVTIPLEVMLLHQRGQIEKVQTQQQTEQQQEPQQKQYFLTNGGTMTQPPGSSFSTTSKGETYFSPEGSAFSYGTGANAGKKCFHYGDFADCK
jgi:hypothetical protein